MNHVTYSALLAFVTTYIFGYGPLVFAGPSKASTIASTLLFLALFAILMFTLPKIDYFNRHGRPSKELSTSLLIGLGYVLVLIVLSRYGQIGLGDNDAFNYAASLNDTWAWLVVPLLLFTNVFLDYRVKEDKQKIFFSNVAYYISLYALGNVLYYAMFIFYFFANFG